MSKPFSILLSSRMEPKRPEGVWLPMPATEEQFHTALERLGIPADNPQDFFVEGFANTEEYPLDVSLSVIQGSTMNELNYLAALLEMQSNEEREKFILASALGEHTGSIKDRINLTQNLDRYRIYPAIHSEADYGHYLIDERKELELPEEAKKYFQYEAYGRNAVQSEKGQFTEQGYVYHSGASFSERYNGQENDIPEEYRMMGSPKHLDPERSEQDEPASGQKEPLPETQSTPQMRPVNPILLTAGKPDEKLKEITDRLEQGITELFDSERYKEYLQVMSKFHNYSFNNTVLIAMQKPDASLIAGFQAWKHKFGRTVRKGEKGIRIIAPAPYKAQEEVEKVDRQTGKPVLDEDGNPVMETKEIQIPAYRVVSVFDISQTEGRELPTLAVKELMGDVEQYGDFFAALEKTALVPITFEPIEGNSHGYYHLAEKRIAIAEGMSELQNLKTAIHEIAHAKLHDLDLRTPQEGRSSSPDRSTKEVQAESIAYTVCQHYGLDTSDYSFGYIAGWSSGQKLAELKRSLATICSTAAELINSIDQHIAEIRKERESEQERRPDLNAEPTVTILWSESSQLRDGETIPLSRANTRIKALDEANLTSPGYDKTKFRIDYVMNGIPDHYEGRQDLGDGEGSLIEHIQQYHTYYADNPDWDRFLLQSEGREALKADKKQREMLLNEWIPYLKLHCNLSEMEQITGEALQKGDTLSPAERAYHTAVQAYVSQCRGLLNQGDYRLPPAPQLRDFDSDLQAYKEHVKEELAQEAEAAGMTVEEYAANGYEPYTALEEEPERQAQPASETDQDTPAVETLTELQQKAVAIAKEYEKLPMKDKIGVIAQAFGCTSGKIKTSPCTGKWRGTSDIFIQFDYGASLFIGNHRTPKAKTRKVQNACINSALVRYNPEIIRETKEAAIAALRKQETKDNEIAAQKGLKPYTLLNVEFNDGAIGEKSGNYMGWYYVTIAVDGNICAHIETGLNYAILEGKVSEMPIRETYFTAGALKEAEVDYVFHNVDFSSNSILYSLPIHEEVRERAEQTLAEREEARNTAEVPMLEQTEPDQDTFSIYQLKDGDAMWDYHFQSYDRLQAAGLSVEAANYELIYTAELAAGTSLEEIDTRFNIDRPSDFKGHSLSISDIVVLHQNGQDTAYYVDRFGYMEVPEFLQGQKQLTPNELMTGEQNDNQIEHPLMAPTADEREAKARSGSQISFTEYAAALKAEKTPSIRVQLKADWAVQNQRAESKSQDFERS